MLLRIGLKLSRTLLVSVVFSRTVGTPSVSIRNTLLLSLTPMLSAILRAVATAATLPPERKYSKMLFCVTDALASLVSLHHQHIIKACSQRMNWNEL